MYNFKIKNICIPDKMFNESCFFAVSDAKYKLGNTTYITTELKDGTFSCNGNANENLEVMESIRVHLSAKRFIEGIDYTINVLIEN